MNSVEQHWLATNLFPVSLRELLFGAIAPCQLYQWENDHFALKLQKGDSLGKKNLARLLSQGTSKLFAQEEGYQEIINEVQNKLVQATRSLSIGNSLDNCMKVLNLLSLNMHYLYEFPTNDTYLQLHIRCSRSLCRFLLTKPAIHKKVINQYFEQKHHYIFSQPILASIFLLGILAQSPLIERDQIERLFLISLFKDIGMSVVPIEKYEQIDLAPEDKDILMQHPDFSVMLLEKRAPFDQSALDIIRHHHAFSLLEDRTIKEILERKNLLVGMETIMISVVDIIAAMISKRPYRQAGNLFDALELARLLIANRFPVEFKLIVTYFKSIFSN